MSCAVSRGSAWSARSEAAEAAGETAESDERALPPELASTASPLPLTGAREDEARGPFCSLPTPGDISAESDRSCRRVCRCEAGTLPVFGDVPFDVYAVSIEQYDVLI